MNADVPLETLYAILARDPDAGTVQPTHEDHIAFASWAIRTHGAKAYDAYRFTNWQPVSEG